MLYKKKLSLSASSTAIYSNEKQNKVLISKAETVQHIYKAMASILESVMSLVLTTIYLAPIIGIVGFLPMISIILKLFYNYNRELFVGSTKYVYKIVQVPGEAPTEVTSKN